MLHQGKRRDFMNKWFYTLAIVTFILFCLLWMTYNLPFVEAMDNGVSSLLYGTPFLALFHYLGSTAFVFISSQITDFVLSGLLQSFYLFLLVFPASHKVIIIYPIYSLDGCLAIVGLSFVFFGTKVENRPFLNELLT